MLQLKDGALVCGNQYINTILIAAQTVYGRHGWPTWITSGRDSHETGYHPQDRALDLRCAMIPEVERPGIRNELAQMLPKFYDVVYEPEIVVNGVVKKGAHFHIEADAKKEAVY